MATLADLRAGPSTRPATAVTLVDSPAVRGAATRSSVTGMRGHRSSTLAARAAVVAWPPADLAAPEAVASTKPRAEAREWATAARRGRVEAEQLAPEALLLPVLQVARRLMVTAKGRHRESRDRVPAAAEPLREQLVPPREVMARRPRAWPQARRAAQAVPPAPRPAAVPVLPGAAVVAAEVVLRCPASRRAVEPVRRVLLVPRARRPA
jgi:hypothetical protein